MRFTMLFQFAVLRNVSCFAEHLSNVLNYFYLKSISNFGLFYLIITSNNVQIIKIFLNTREANREEIHRRFGVTKVFVYEKKQPKKAAFSEFGAQKKTRTSTSLRILVPETSASTNSAIWALLLCDICVKVLHTDKE